MASTKRKLSEFLVTPTGKIATALAFVALVANLVQIHELFTASLAAVFWVASTTALVICVVFLAVRAPHGGLRTAILTAITLLSTGSFASAGYSLFRAEETPRQAQPTVSAVPSTPPPRTLAAWAADINSLCREHLTAAGTSLDEMRGPSHQLNILMENYDVTDTAQSEKYLDDLTRQVKELLPGLSKLDTTYMIIGDSAASIELPEDSTQRSGAEAWLALQRERNGEITDLYKAFETFTSKADRLSRTVALFDAIGAINAYGKLQDQVLADGDTLGIKSCP